VTVPEHAEPATVTVDRATTYQCTAVWLAHGMAHGLGQRLASYGVPLELRPAEEPQLRSWPTRRCQIDWGAPRRTELAA